MSLPNDDSSLQEMVNGNPSIADNLRRARELDAEKTHERIQTMLQVLPIALRAVYQSADAGNVRCKAAVLEIETILRTRK